MNAEGKLVSFVHGGNVHAWARERGGEIRAVLDYSANINPLGLSESVRQALFNSIEQVIHYPDVEASALKECISNHYQVDTSYITAGNGAVELLYVLAHILRPKRVLIPAPAFSEYERAARAAGAAIEYMYLPAENNFVLDIDLLCSRLVDLDIVFIGNPNNPTGTLLQVNQLEKLLFSAKKAGTMVVVDESFMDFISDNQEYTCRPLLSRYDNLVILYSLTKFYAIPGLRLGFCLTNSKLTIKLHAAKDPWNVNSLAQAAGVAALADKAYQTKSREIIECQKTALYTKLRDLEGVKPFAPAVNYILVDITQSGYTAAEVSQALAVHGVLIRNCANYPGLSPYYMRVAVKLAEQNKILLGHLERVLRRKS